MLALCGNAGRLGNDNVLYRTLSNIAYAAPEGDFLDRLVLWRNGLGRVAPAPTVDGPGGLQTGRDGVANQARRCRYRRPRSVNKDREARFSGVGGLAV